MKVNPNEKIGMKTISEKQLDFLTWVLFKDKIKQKYSDDATYKFLATDDIRNFFYEKCDYGWYESSFGEMYIEVEVNEFVQMIRTHKEYPEHSVISQKLNAIRLDLQKEYLMFNGY